MPKTIQSIERAAAILRLLSGRTPRLRVVDLAGELGLPKATVHGILRTLTHVGFVEQDAESGKYQLGAALLHMGSSYLDGNELRLVLFDHGSYINAVVPSGSVALRSTFASASAATASAAPSRAAYISGVQPPRGSTVTCLPS